MSKAYRAVSDVAARLKGDRLAIEMGATSLATDGFATAIPATALVTETAGVKMPSAIVRDVPNRH